MAHKLGTKERRKLRKKDFGLPGKRKYPIPDKAHARNALARVAQNGTPAEQKKVKAAVKRRFPSIGKEEEQEEVAPVQGLAFLRPALHRTKGHVVRACAYVPAS